MAMRLEKMLDRKIRVKDDEADFSDEARERIYQQGIYQRRTIKKVAVPTGVIRQIPPGSDGKPNDVVQFASGGSEYLREDEIGAGLEVVDARLLGADGHRFDEVFDEVRGPQARNRYERIQKMSSRCKLVGLLAVAAAAGAGLSAATVSNETVVKINDRNSCSGPLGPANGQYLERVVNPSPGITQPMCTLAGQEYLITNPVAK